MNTTTISMWSPQGINNNSILRVIIFVHIFNDTTFNERTLSVYAIFSIGALLRSFLVIEGALTYKYPLKGAAYQTEGANLIIMITD